MTVLLEPAGAASIVIADRRSCQSLLGNIAGAGELEGTGGVELERALIRVGMHPPPCWLAPCSQIGLAALVSAWNTGSR